jgi:hypothetical protein
MKRLQQGWLLGLALIATALLLACGGGGGDGNWCPGAICTNCARDCLDIELDCGEGQSEACVGGSYFDADEDLRCVFCVDE